MTLHGQQTHPSLRGLMQLVWQADPCSFASGSDDGTVRLWSLRCPMPTATIDTKANVCSVQWSPTNPHLLALGSANCRAFVYDRRQVRPAPFRVCRHAFGCGG